jgi:tRNA nucleotidyltransferase (CCA-adding enzyme)
LTSLDLLQVLNGYATWLQGLKAQDLLEVDSLKSLVNGTQLSKALKAKPGPWMTKALEVVIEWQLRNPKSDDAEEAIAEVRRRKEEIGLV